MIFISYVQQFIRAKQVFLCLMLLFSFVFSSELFSMERTLSLKGNLQRAKAGDYLVTAQDKNYSVLLIRNKNEKDLTIEEITVPNGRIPTESFSWKNWIENGAPGNTCWVMYVIDLSSGTIQRSFSFTKNQWINISQSQNFLSTLLNLNFKPIAENERKKVGPRPAADSYDRRRIWQPPLIVEGKKIPDVAFDGWRTRWPKDSSELSEKFIEVYMPKDSDKYPAYFPYWLQVNGVVGKAKVRIVDSGSGLASPAQLFPP